MNRRDFFHASAGFTALSAFGVPLFASQAMANSCFVAFEIPKATLFERVKRAQEMMVAQNVDLLMATPSTNFTYLVGYNPGRSERLIAILVPREGNPVIVAPSFEKERIMRRSVVSLIDVWEEHENPFRLAATVAERLKVASGKIGIEPTTNYQDYLRLKDALPRASFVDGSVIFDELRMAKTVEEIDAIKKAITITLAAIAATHQQLKEGLSEQEVSGILSKEMSSRGSSGGGLVQFGPSSALPHGGPTGAKLSTGTVVLIDAGCRVDGYTSDITRTVYWGADPPPKYREVYDAVFEAQQASAAFAKAGVECQEMDRTARQVIERAGYGKYFTHRLGHGLGMDGHEQPYLVEGNRYRLKPGHVVTIEPGIYMLGDFGVRIEDDFVITEFGIEQLSAKVSRI